MSIIRIILTTFISILLIFQVQSISAADPVKVNAFKLNLKNYIRNLSQNEKSRIKNALLHDKEKSNLNNKVTAKSQSIPQPQILKPPTWTYTTGSNVDSIVYNNVLIGEDPQIGRNTDVDVVVFPVTVKLHKSVKSFDSSSFTYTTVNKNTVISMVTKDQCLPEENRVPFDLVKESPLFNPENIRFGDTVLENSQYIDAHQRATFWDETSQDTNGYHLNLNAEFSQPLIVDVPGSHGIAVNSSILFGGNQSCGTIAQIDISWLDNYLRNKLIPSLSSKNLLSPERTPIFLIKNLGLAGNTSTPFSINYLGYHDVIVGGAGSTTKLQTYMVSDFGAGALANSLTDIQTLSHEIGEWVNDPFINNVSPAVDFAGSCFPLLAEVGDYLNGNVATHVSLNQYTYHLQEMAFLPWFFGGAKTSINGWYSANGTLTTPFVKKPCART